MTPDAFLPMLTHLVCIHTLTYQSSIFYKTSVITNSSAARALTITIKNVVELECTAVDSVGVGGVGVGGGESSGGAAFAAHANTNAMLLTPRKSEGELI